MKFVSEFNNRELSIIIWFVIFTIWALTQEKIRNASVSLIKAFFAKKLFYGYLAMLLYITIIIAPFYFLDIWGLHRIKNIVLWITCVAFVMLMQFSKATDKYFFKKSVKDNFRILVLLEFIINLYVFSLWIELALVPFSALLGGMIAMAERDEQYKSVKKLLDIILSLMGVVFLAYAIYKVSTDFGNFISMNNLIDLTLPIFLTIMFLPFLYFIALYSNYESLFLRMSFFIKDRAVLSYCKRKVMFSFAFNLQALDKWSKHFNPLVISEKKDINDAIRDFKKMSQ
jgi:hypothetical protein